jgi:hypothetical protein
MSTQLPEKIEDFPIATFFFLETYIGILRRHIMTAAAEMANQESPPEESIYVVREKHVKAVLKQMGLTSFFS